MRQDLKLWKQLTRTASIVCVAAFIPLASTADPCVIRDGSTDTTGVTRINLRPHGSIAETAINLGIPYWQECSGFGSKFPRLVNDLSGEITIDVYFNPGVGTTCAGADPIRNADGLLIGGSITIFAQGLLTDCTDTDEKLGSLLAHEVGHIYGITDVAVGSCDGYIMGRFLPGAMSVQDSECSEVDSLWVTPSEGGGGGGGCGVCIPPSYCVLGFCVTGCLVKWQCDFPAEDCINGQCQPASPVVARVGAQDFLSVVNVWETAFSDAAGGVCIHWNGKDQKCTMTGWPVDPYVGHLVWLTDEEYGLLNLGAELVVDVALNLIGSASPQPPGVSPTRANGFSSLERALGSGDRGYTDFSGCPSDFAKSRKLYFWLDHDTVGKRNGMMQASELKPAEYTGLFGFYPETLVESKQVDAHGNWLRFWVEADCADCGGVMVDYFPVLDSGDLLLPGSIPPAENTCSTVPADLPYGFGPLLTDDR